MSETNPLTAMHKSIREQIDHSDPVHLDDPHLQRIVRLRLVSDPGFPLWDLSYCYGQIDTGEYVRVILPWHQFSKRNLLRDLVAMCQEAGVYGKGLGILDPLVISKLT